MVFTSLYLSSATNVWESMLIPKGIRSEGAEPSKRDS